MHKKQLTHTYKHIVHRIAAEGVPFFVLCSLIIIYAAFFTYVTFQRHALFITGMYDLGNMDQTVWNTLHGRIFVFTNPDFNVVLSRLSVHSDFILILLAPFYLLWNSPLMLLLIQTTVISLGALFIYLIGRDIFSNKWLSVAFAFSYLLNPYVQEQNMFDFHAVSLATTFLLAAFYFLKKNKYIVFSLFALLALLTKEQVFLVVGLFGLYILISKKKLWGIVVSFVCFIAFYLIVAKFIPDARKGAHFALSYYGNFGLTPKDIILTFFTNPFKVLSTVWKNDVLRYVQYLFMPVGYLSFVSPLYLVSAAPDFFINMLSTDDALRSYYYHYAAAILPFIYISALYAARQIVRFLATRYISVFLICYIFFSSLYAAWYFGPLPGAKMPNLDAFQPTGEEQEVSDYLNIIPRSEAVAASNNLAPHLSHREKIYSLPTGVSKANLVLFYFSKNENPTMKNADSKLVQQLSVDPKFQIVYQLDNFIVFERINQLK